MINKIKELKEYNNKIKNFKECYRRKIEESLYKESVENLEKIYDKESKMEFIIKSFFSKADSERLKFIDVFLEDEVDNKEEYVSVVITLTDSKKIGYIDTDNIVFYIKGYRKFFGSFAIEGDNHFWGNDSIKFSEIFGGSDMIKIIAVTFGKEFKCNVNMSRMFEGCKNLEEVYIEGKMDNVIGKEKRIVSSMFEGCEKLKEVSGLKYVIDCNTISTEDMFYGCRSLEKIGEDGECDTSSIDNMRRMFYGCESLLSLPNMSKWNMNCVNEMGYMCYGCKSIKKVKLGELGNHARSLNIGKSI